MEPTLFDVLCGAVVVTFSMAAFAGSPAESRAWSSLFGLSIIALGLFG